MNNYTTNELINNRKKEAKKELKTVLVLALIIYFVTLGILIIAQSVQVQKLPTAQHCIPIE